VTIYPIAELLYSRPDHIVHIL